LSDEPDATISTGGTRNFRTDLPVEVDERGAEGEGGEAAAVEVDVGVVDETPPAAPLVRRRWSERGVETARDIGIVCRDNAAPICLVLTLCGITIWAGLFVSLGVRNHRNFGTWSFDMAIYDQAFWLVSQGGQTFMTVRGIDVWGHHLNLIAYVFAPFYRWFGAGPEFLYVVQNTVIALGALPVYLIAKLRFGGAVRWWAPYVGLTFAIAYLLYPSAQFIAWINFHPEALVITPFLFAWYFALRRRWVWFFVFVGIALSLREDVALAVIMLGVVLLVVNWHSGTRRRDMQIALATVMLGLVWYVLATQLIIRHYNSGEPPFYLNYFFQNYGGSFSGIIRNIIGHPDWVIRDATQPDRLRFYRDLGLPLGGFAVVAPVHLLMAAPQMLASVIGTQVYARQILYQYPSVMVAPIVIASIEGARVLWRRFDAVKKWLVPWLLLCAYVSHVAWSPSPIGARYTHTWARNNPRAETLREAVDLVPDDAVVTSSYNLGPHLSRREGSYDWPNPFWPAYWGNEEPGRQDCRVFPSASVVDYIVLDIDLFDEDRNQMGMINGLIAPGGQFEVVMDRDLVLVARRVEPGPDGDPLMANCPGGIFEAFVINDIDPPPEFATDQSLTLPPASTVPSPSPEDETVTGATSVTDDGEKPDESVGRSESPAEDGTTTSAP
jgi:uncharacterized membrane protein